MTQNEVELVHDLDREMRINARMAKVIHTELLRLEEALIAFERGKGHVTEAYLHDAIEALRGAIAE